MRTSVAVPLLIIAILLITVTAFQVKGLGSGMFGDSVSSFRTRRGFEQVLFRATIVLVVMFCLLALLNFRFFTA